jgi:hypothetical protein
MSDVDIAWAAGLFEGGSWVTHYGGRYLGAELTSIDEDVVRRFHQIVGVGNVIRREPQRPGNKPRWRWGVYNESGFRHVFALFAGYQGVRQQRRAEELLDELGALAP